MNIVFPMGLLAIFTLLYFVIMLTGRTKAMKNGDVKISYFKEYNNDTPPSYVQKATRQWSNLYEVPVLFYAVCAAILALNIDDVVLIYMGYVFLCFRIIQAVIHTTYNHIMHRFLMFACGLITVLSMWIRLLLIV